MPFFSLFVKFWDVGPTCHLYWLLYLSMTNDSNYSLYLNWFSLNWFIFSWHLQTNTRTTWVFKFEALPKPNCIHSNVKETPTQDEIEHVPFSYLQPSLPWWSAGLTFSLAKGRRRDGNSNYVQDIYSQDFRDEFKGVITAAGISNACIIKVVNMLMGQIQTNLNRLFIFIFQFTLFKNCFTFWLCFLFYLSSLLSWTTLRWVERPIFRRRFL